MAGIGFELRKLYGKGAYYSIAEAYGYAGLLSAGPWIISIIGILALNFVHYKDISPEIIPQFQVSITYLIAVSLIVSGIAQHSFTRYVADQLFVRCPDRVLPNFNGALLILTVGSGVLGYILAALCLPEENLYYQLLVSSCFVILCDIWLLVNLLSGLKTYKTICLVFFLGYGVSILVAYFLRYFGLEGLMTGFGIGQFILLVGLSFAVYYGYPSDRLIEFDFLKPNKIFISLVFTSVFYNLGVWIDKFIFWYMPLTKHSVIGLLNSSPIFDVPLFLAFITIIPGMAAFLFHMEIDFTAHYARYYNAIREGATLSQIINYRYQLIISAKEGIYDIIKVQGVMVFVIFAVGPNILSWLHISTYYIYLLNVDTIGASLLVLFLSLLNIIFYLDKRRWALILSAVFLVGNLVFTLITVKLGVFYYGYGFAASLIVVCVLGALLLDHDFNQLEYETFTHID